MLKPTINKPLEPRFDWYQATVKFDENELFQVLEPLTSEFDYVVEKPKLKNYAECYRMGGLGGSLMVHLGGVNGRDHGPNVQGTGPLSPRVAELLRASGVPHSVGRADVCIDFLGDFDDCHLAFVNRCNEAGMGSKDVGSSKGSVMQLGRTVYGGSVTSAYRPCCYEKGIQLGEGYPSNFIRLEHRFMFSKAADKQMLSKLTPVEMCGLRPVARDLTETLAGLSVAPYKLNNLPKVKDWYHWMLEAYGRHIREMEADLGSPAAFGCQVMHDLNEKAIKERMRSTH